MIEPYRRLRDGRRSLDGTQAEEDTLVFGQIFNPNNGFFRVTGKLVDVVLLSLLWLVTSLPLFTVGPATAALYYAVVKDLRRGETESFVRLYFRSFRLNFKVGALTSLIVLAVIVLLYCVYCFVYLLAMTGEAGYMAYFAFLVVLVVLAGWWSYLFPVLSRFTFGVGGLIGTCFRLALGHLPTTAALGLLTALSAWACLRFWWPVAFLPALAALAASLLLERIFQPFVDIQRAEEGAQPPQRSE